jgi:hypothetical protein
MLRKLMVAGVSVVSLLMLIPPAEAQVRVFVSVTGNDANVCSNVATPCRTLAGGITQVDPDGEVIVIASGSYAGGTITKAVKIDVASGVVAFSGTPIVVNPGSGNRVVLRGLTIKAVTNGSGFGIDHQTGTLYVENTVIDGWSTGLRSLLSAERLFVKGSVFRNNANNGLNVLFGSLASVAIDQSFFENNEIGILFQGGTGRVSNTVMTANLTMGASVENAGAQATFQRCEVSSNLTGLGVSSTGVLRVSESTLTRNDFGLSNNASTLESFGNNVIRGNGTNTAGPITMVTLQ